MSAFSKKTSENPSQILGESPEDILRRKRAVTAMAESRVGDAANPTSQSSADNKQVPSGIAAEKSVGALCFLPKSIHRLASRHAEDHDLTSKRFFFETMLLGLEQQGVISHEQRIEALTLPNEYGWKGRDNKVAKE